MHPYETLRKLEGLQTVETAAQLLSITRQSALNLLCRLRKEGHVTVDGGGRRKRIYNVTMRRQLPRVPGMFDIINRHSPMKILPWYDHQVHGRYGPEEAIVDAVETQKFRVILASLRLFSHVRDWPRLYAYAQEKGCWRKVGALYDVARMFFRVRTMPERYRKAERVRGRVPLTQLRKDNFPAIARHWSVYLPFNEHDLKAIT